MKILKYIYEFCEKVEPKITNFLNNGGMKIVFILAGFGIITAVLGHYMKVGFNWKWFIFFELPLYIFLSWALFKVSKVWKDINKNN